MTVGDGERHYLKDVYVIPVKSEDLHINQEHPFYCLPGLPVDALAGDDFLQMFDLAVLAKERKVVRSCAMYVAATERSKIDVGLVNPELSVGDVGRLKELLCQYEDCFSTTDEPETQDL